MNSVVLVPNLFNVPVVIAKFKGSIMKIYLCAREDDLFQAWTTVADKYEFVEATRQDIMSIKAEAIVSPANSFGYMTGGIDLLYKNYFGQKMEDDLRAVLADKYNYELPVGLAVSVPLTEVPPTISYKYLISAPTMRVPVVVKHTLNAFLAAKAALIEADRLGVESVVIPGLGTGTGDLAAMDCARQVGAAIDYIIINRELDTKYPLTYRAGKYHIYRVQP